MTFRTDFVRNAWWRKPWAVGLAGSVFALVGMTFAMRMIETATLPKTSLTTLAGQTTNLRALAAGKAMVVNLWATWCPPCRLELPYLAAAQLQEPEVRFVFVDQGEDAATIQRYLSAVHLQLDNVMLDMGGKLSQEIGAPGLPITLFYDAGGRMVDSHVGALSPALLDQKLTSLRPRSSRAAKE